MRFVTPAALALLGTVALVPVASAQTPGTPPQGRGRMFEGLPDSLRTRFRERMQALPDTTRRRIFSTAMGLPEDQRAAYVLRELGLGGTAAAPATPSAAAPPTGETPTAPVRTVSADEGAILRGVVRDSAAMEPFPGATVKALRTRRPNMPASDTLAAGGVTDVDGVFRLLVPPGSYRLRVESPGFRRVSRTVTVAAGDIATFPAISLEGAGGEAGEIVVEGDADVVRVSGDTVSFRAESIRLAPGSTSEDLVRRVPGISIENGQVNVRGERVSRVTVDGQDFFGNDALTTLQSLPADLIRDVQVLDQASEQSRFTGFDDGNRERTINLVTRPDRRRGVFGRLSAGGSAEERYIVDGAVNLFRGNQRSGVTFLTNNVNQEQFAFEDLAASGAMEAFRGGGGGGGMSMGGGGGRIRFGPGGFGVAADGEVATHGLGLTYSNRTAKGVQLSLSATGMASIGHANSLSQSLYNASSPVRSFASDSSVARTLNQNLRVQGRLEMPFSERTQLTLTTRVNAQNSDSDQSLASLVLGPSASLLSQALNANANGSTGYAGLANALLRHRLSKPGRTISANVALGYNQSDADRTTDSDARYGRTGLADSLVLDARRITTDAQGLSYSATFAYTEPLARNTQLQLTLNPSANWNESDQDARRLDPTTLADIGPYPRYENDVDQSVNRVRGGAQVQTRWGSGWRFTAGLDGQREAVSSEQTIAGAVPVDKAYVSALPQVTLAFQPQGANMRGMMRGGTPGGSPAGSTGGSTPQVSTRMRSGELSYRTSTDVPSVSQLGRVPDDTNPLSVSSGNAALQPSYTHQFRGRFFDVEPVKGNVNMAFASVNFGQNYIGNETILVKSDTTIDGIALGPGAQFSRPVNLDGQRSMFATAMIGRAVPGLPFTANLGLNASRNETPTRLNGTEATSLTNSLGGSLMLTTTRTNGWDGSISYNPTLSSTERPVVGSSAMLSQSFVTHRATGSLRARPGKMILETDVTLQAYTGDNTADSPTQVFWNAALGYTFGGANPLELRLVGTDLLDQSNGYNQAFQTLYTQTTTSNALGRYVMLRATWRFNSMTGAARAQQGVPGMPPGGGPVIIRRGGDDG